MKYIELPKDKLTMVDDGDFEYLDQFKWNFNSRYVVRNQHNNCYSNCKGKGCSKVFMHRLIMNTPKGMETDHINGNTLDNRRENLRVVTRKQNSYNMKHFGKSGFKGVYLSGKKWVAQANYQYLGRFDTREEAALAYNIAATEYFGEYARLNKI